MAGGGGKALERRIFRAFDHGIFSRLLNSDGSINSVVWNQAVHLREHVGTCRHCGGWLLGQPTHQSGRITWYGYRCTECHREGAAPNAEVLRRSGRWAEMPADWEGHRSGKNK